MKKQYKTNKIDNRQGETTSDRMHENQSPRAQTKINGINNSGGQGANETSNKYTGGDQGNKK